MTVYISGPIEKNDNAEDDFADAYIRLHNLGHNPVSPVDIGRALKYKIGREPTWAEYMREDIKALMDCDGIYFLEGSETSVGSRVERAMAYMVDIQVVTL